MPSSRAPFGGRLGIALTGAIVAASALLATAGAHAGPPGTLRSAAAGDGHLWWAVRRIAPEVPGAARPGDSPEYLLMHHASVEPAPTERFVMRLRAEPEAIAAEGASVAVVLPAEGERKRLVLLTGTRRNETVGHWYTEPRGAPRILAPLDERGSIVGAEMAGGTIFIVRTVRTEGDAVEAAATLELLALSTDVGAEWKPAPLPPLAAGWTLFRDGATLCAIGRDADGAAVARLSAGQTWTVERLPAREGVATVGAFAMGGRVVVVERTAMAGAPASVALSIMRGASRSDWATFTEPTRPWAAAPFGSDAVVLELDEAGRGSVRAIPTTANAPGDAVTLLPPGFASGSWVHLPILAAVSVAFALAAMIFGSDAYLQSRNGRAPRGPRPLGVGPSRRLLAFAIDMAPAFVITWIVVGGSPLVLLDHPLLSANIAAAIPAAIVLAGGWLFAAVGDAVLGASLGKRAMGLVVIGRDGQRAGLGPRVVRSLLSLVAVVSPIVMLIVLMHPWGDGPAEMLSGTAVVNETEWRALAVRRPATPTGE